MKILFLGDSKSYNTISWLSDLKNEIKSIDIEIISLANDGLNKNFLSKILILFSFLQKTKQTIKTFDPDILIAYRTTSYGFLGSLTGFHPFVVAQQGQSDLSLKKGFKRFILSKLRKLCLKKADLIHVWTLHQKKSVLKNNIPEQKILLKPRGINLDIFSFNGSRDLKENHIIITRSLYPEYNHLKLIRVIENLISINCNFKLSIVGKGPQKDNIIKIINDLKLNDNIASILKIIEVPPLIANKYQLNSPFSEVHAMNAAFRRSSGTFFGRIDQDTLIGERFVDWFYRKFHEENIGFDWPLVAFSGRRNLDPKQSLCPYNFIFDNEKYKEVNICHSNNFYSRVHPKKQSMLLFYGGAVGILLIHRDLYIKSKGYNETYIYMNNMDTEFLNRLKRERNDFYNLGLKCDGDFYHLHHSRKDGAKEDSQLHAKESGSRKTNPPIMREAEPFNPNSDNWGLRDEDLNVVTFR